MNAIHRLAQTSLSTVEREALAELKRRLLAEFDFVEQLILFGSAARGTADEESDIDLLVLTKCRLPNSLRHQITYMIFDLNLEYQTNFSTLVVSVDEWDDGLISVLPIKSEIDREGIQL
jgi:uncharacterized protein